MTIKKRRSLVSLLFTATLIIILGAWALLAIGSEVYIQNNIDPRLQEMRNIWQPLLPKIIADAKLLDANPLFPENTYERDAASLLINHITWSGDGIQPNKASAELNEEFQKKYSKWKTDQAIRDRLLNDKDFLARFDTSWVEKLQEFDHLSITSHPVTMSLIASAATKDGISRTGVIASLPMPDFNEIRTWALVHAIKQAQDGKALEGLQTYRKFAQLAHSSSSLIGAMIAADMLKSEATIKEMLKADEWQTIPEATVNAYRRLAWAVTGLLRDQWLHPIPQELEVHLNSKTALCIGGFDTFIGPLMFQDFLEPQFPFERDFRTVVEKSREQFAQYFKNCGLQAYEPLLKNENSTFDLNHFPYVRRATALSLITIATPKMTQLYEENPAAQ